MKTTLAMTTGDEMRASRATTFNTLLDEEGVRSEKKSDYVDPFLRTKDI